MPKPLSVEEFASAKASQTQSGLGGQPMSIEQFAATKSASPQKTQIQKPSLLKRLGTELTRLPARAAVNVGVGIDALRGIGGNQEVGQRALKIGAEGVDSPTYGKLRPLGMTGQGFGKDIKDVAGAGLEASSFLPIARLPALGAQTLKTGIKQGAKAFAKEGAVAGALAGAGSEMQRPESSLGSTVKSGAIGAGVGALAGGALGGGIGAVPVVKASRALAREKKVTDTLKRILQGDIKDIETGRKAFRQVDLSDVKTYKEGAERIREQVGAISRGVDEALGTDPTPRKLDSLALRTTVGGETVEQNYVRQALEQLQEHYTKTNDLVKATEARQLLQKAETEGLTLTEINNIARQHGVDLNAFNLNGELASGLKKQAVENTRRGVKATSRDLFGNNITKAADAEITKLKRVEKLFDDMAEKVNDLQSKVMKRGIGARAARLIVDTVDILSGGFLKGLGRSLLVERGQGANVFNALDLEKQLQKNLKLIQKATNADATEATIIQALEQFVKNTTGKLPQIKESQIILNKPVGKKGLQSIPRTIEEQELPGLDSIGR